MGRTMSGGVLLTIALVVAGCTGSSQAAPSATPTASAVAAETPTAVATPQQTPAAEAELVSDEARIAAAVAAFEANPQPDNLIAYDYLEPLVSGTQVRLNVCGWTGETVFDDTYQIAYRVGNTTDDQGEINVAFESANTTLDTCTNSALIESALQATRDFDNYWRGVIEDPSTFNQEEASAIITPEYITFLEDAVAGWKNDGLAYRNSFFDGELPESTVTEPLARSYVADDFDVYEIITCRDLTSGFGLYRGNVLIDDFTNGDGAGPHALVQYLLTRRDGTWKLLGVLERVHADCLGFTGGWIEGVNRNFPDPGEWELLQ